VRDCGGFVCEHGVSVSVCLVARQGLISVDNAFLYECVIIWRTKECGVLFLVYCVHGHAVYVVYVFL
jgi:hypothetical protein